MTEVPTATALAVIEARDIPPPPTLESFADDLYDSMLPVAWLDGESGWHLALYCAAVGVMFQWVASLARDTPEGPGWSAVMDLARCPDDWLPWLGQFAGVTVPPDLTPAQARVWIAQTDGFRRGTPAALRAATQKTLTGSRTVVMQERLGGNAYVLGLYTLTSETPDQDATLAAILAQKPAGIRLDYSVGPANTYQAIEIAFADYAAVKAAFPTYGHMAAGIST